MQQQKRYRASEYNQGFVAFFIFLAAIAAIAYFFIFNKNNQELNPNPDAPAENVVGTGEATTGTEKKNESKTETAPPVQNQASSEKTSPPPTTGPVYDVAGRVVVSYTNSGFSPFIAHVRLTKSIIFINESDSALWVIAVEDPSTRVSTYSEFNSGKSIAKGEAYIFSFTKEGLFTYRNKNNDAHTGAVLVTVR